MRSLVNYNHLMFLINKLDGKTKGDLEKDLTGKIFSQGKPFHKLLKTEGRNKIDVLAMFFITQNGQSYDRITKN